MFASDYILHADYHGVSGFYVSYVPIKLKFLMILPHTLELNMSSDLPNLTIEFLPAEHMFVIT